jgi:hypothetical protein
MIFSIVFCFIALLDGCLVARCWLKYNRSAVSRSVSPYLQCGSYDVRHFHWLVSKKKRLSLLNQWRLKTVQTTGRAVNWVTSSGLHKMQENCRFTSTKFGQSVSQSICQSVCLFISSNCIANASYFGPCGTPTARVRQNTTLLRRRNTTQHMSIECSTFTLQKAYENRIYYWAPNHDFKRLLAAWTPSAGGASRTP